MFHQIAIHGFGQKLKLEIGSGWGIYSMKELKEFNESILENIPVEAAITDNFPSRLYYDASINYLANQKFSMGFTYSYTTTGSRISYNDYSGELKYDDIVSGHSPGVHITILLRNKLLRFSQETNFSYCFTKLKIQESILGTMNQLTFKSGSLHLEPRMIVSYRFSQLEIAAKIGYLIDFGSKYRYKDDTDVILRNLMTDETIQNNWSGIRVALSIGLLL